MLARMIVRSGKYGTNSKSLLLSQVRKTAEAIRVTRIHQGLSIDSDDKTDLFAIITTRYGPSEVIQMLHADVGVCADPIDKHVQYAMLALSTWRNDMDSVRSILGSGAELDQYSGTFGSVIYIATTYGNLEIFQLLHQYGAEINGPAGWWRGNCLQTPALGGHVEIVRSLLSGDLGLDLERNDYKPRLKDNLYRMAGNDIDNDLVAAIMCAIRSGNDMVVQDLLKQLKGRPLQLADRTSQRIRKAAIKTCRETCLHAVLRDIRYDSNILGMVLRDAVVAANQIQMKQILAASALQAPEPDWTSCALEYAARFHLVECLNVVLAHGDTISPRSAARIMCSALGSRNHDIVRMLIDHRIGLPYGENSSIPALDFACGPSLRPGQRLRIVKEQAPLSAAAYSYKNLELFKKFIDNGTNLTCNDAGIWALNMAAWGGNIPAVQIFLEAGVDAAAGMPSDPNWTPMKLAAINGRRCLVRFLEQSGHEISVIDPVQV